MFLCLCMHTHINIHIIHVLIHTYMCTNMSVWVCVVVMRCFETLCMDWRMSPVFSSFWGQVYSQASQHLYCLDGEKKKHLSKCIFNATLLSVREGCQMVALQLTKGLTGQEEQKENSSSSWSHGALPCLCDVESRLITCDCGNLNFIFI